MPQFQSPQPSSEFSVTLAKPFSGTQTHQITIIGQPNGDADIKVNDKTSSSSSQNHTGTASKANVKTLLELLTPLRGFKTDSSKDIYGKNVLVTLNQKDEAGNGFGWANNELYQGSIQELSDEDKDTFSRVVDSIENLARTYANSPAAI